MAAIMPRGIYIKRVLPNRPLYYPVLVNPVRSIYEIEIDFGTDL